MYAVAKPPTEARDSSDVRATGAVVSAAASKLQRPRRRCDTQPASPSTCAGRARSGPPSARLPDRQTGLYTICQIAGEGLNLRLFRDGTPVEGAVRMQLRRCRVRGVTLVEVLIVVAIMSLIAGAVAIFAVPHFKKTQLKAAQHDTMTLVQVVDTYRLSRPEAEKECPTFEQLKQYQAVRANQSLVDPWQRPYRIVCDGAQFGVTSSGPDGVAGNDDDIWAGAQLAK